MTRQNQDQDQEQDHNLSDYKTERNKASSDRLRWL